MYTPLPISSEEGPVVAPRREIHPRYIDGRYHRLRNLSSTVLQVLLFAVPWLRWGERPLVWLDLPGRKLHLPGFTLWPQETHFLWLGLAFLALTLFLTTTLVGRVWCGYACPQTLLSQSFMLVERWVEGDRRQRRSRRPLTLLIWALMSVWLGVTLLGYFSPERSITPLTLGIGALAFLNFGFFREQMCHYVCPYARFQGALFDNETLLVTYDAERGEPRGRKGQAQGSCVDCNWCVQVCPMGIDIREGSQLECIACAACVDACRPVMAKLGRPTGLIDYLPRKPRLWRPRVQIYLALLTLVGSLLVVSWLQRSPWDFTVVRRSNPSVSAQGEPVNFYELHLMNRSERPVRLEVTVRGGTLALPGNPFTLAPGELARGQAAVTAPRGETVRSLQFEVRNLDRGDVKWKTASFLQL